MDVTEPQLGEAVVPLLRGVVYAESQRSAWDALLAMPGPPRDFLAVLGLEVVINESEGYAYLRQAESDDESTTPRLIARRPLSYRVSLLLALLRRRLMELDAQGGDTRLVLTRDETVELVRTSHPARTNETKLVADVEADLRKIADMGFVRQLRDQPHTYEVRRILKAFVDAQWLADFDVRLAEYLALAQESR